MNIGPNAVVQTYRALEELEGSALAQEVKSAAGLPEVTLDGLIPEAWFVTLIDATRARLPPDRAEAVLERSGALTAGYVGARRIPKALRVLLRILPPRLALPLLLEGFRRHAWTFAGSGHYAIEGPYPGTITLEGSPTCRPRAGDSPSPDPDRHAGAYYAAAFEGLLSLAAPRVRVREVACARQGAPLCRFSIQPDGPPGPESTAS